MGENEARTETDRMWKDGGYVIEGSRNKQKKGKGMDRGSRDTYGSKDAARPNIIPQKKIENFSI